MKKKTERIKPRNPLVAPMMLKREGWKEKSSKAQRRDDKVSTRREMKCVVKDFFQVSALYMRAAI